MKQSLLLVFCIAVATLISACKSSDTVTGPVQQVANAITKDTVTGNIKGTMLSGHTYYIKDSITVLAKDTLTLAGRRNMLCHHQQPDAILGSLYSRLLFFERHKR